jgi:acetolactate synthase-1/3 small subunit
MRNAIERVAGCAVLELVVHNHPGVMSHVCGLFARRAWNVEGITCFPEEDPSRSRIWLWIERDHRMEQMVKQAAKLADVVSVRVADESEAREGFASLCPA